MYTTNNNDKNLWSFEKWHNKFFENDSIYGEEFNQFGDYGIKTINPSEDELIQIGSLFDHFICSPNNLYFCEKRQREYPIGSKSRKYKNFVELMKSISQYKKNYEKLFLYSVQIIFETNEYKIRFSVFPYPNYDKFDYLKY
jgi:hypothetical protein